MALITCIAPVNIAVIKYWGKREEDLILPINDSVSGTLSTDYMCAKTTIMASPTFKENRFWLNGKEEKFDSPRLLSCLNEIKRRASSDASDIVDYKIHICSENNFPTAAGLASSAAGYACMVYALAKLYKVQGDISACARMGSGSACRSVYGGWVQWHSGTLKDGTDSIATQIAPASHWPEMRILILVVNSGRKKESSTVGMRRSLETSKLLEYRAKCIVPEWAPQMIRAIKEKNFETFAQIMMRDSNQFHATCLDTFPPCVYMNDVSHAIVGLVHAYNSFRGSIKVGYTYDAGPNACLYMQEQDVSEVVSLIKHIFPSSSDVENYVRGIPVNDYPLSEQLLRAVDMGKYPAGSVKYIIHTNIGEGPKVVENDHLLDDGGLPK